MQTRRWGVFNIQLIGGYLNSLDRIGIPGAPIENDVDQPFSPTWMIGMLAVNYNLRWNDTVLAFSRIAIANTPYIAAGRYLRFDALWQHDLQAQLALPSGFAFYEGVNNLANQEPDPSWYATCRSRPSVGFCMWVKSSSRTEHSFVTAGSSAF